MKEIGFTEIGDIKVGHAHDLNAATGCTVIICEKGATAGVDVRGGAPGTRETDLLSPVNLVDKVHAVFLSGGSAFGLDAAAGLMDFLEEKGIGLDVGVTRVPIVCGAVLFDLTIGDFRVRPDREMGYRACQAAAGKMTCRGNLGAGTGATVGKILGMKRAMKGGLGSSSLQIGELKVGAMAAVNCLGDVVDPLTGERLAGPLSEDMMTVLDTEEIMTRSSFEKKDLFGRNTTIGVVATNAALTKSQATKLASMAQDGFARVMRPAHSMFDGDTIFAVAAGSVSADLSVLGLLGARLMERAVVDAVKSAESLCGIISWSDYKNRKDK
ncbi:MAG: peptidase S58 family protein [Desulfobacteraceae bacterium]|jgi:L-aminopeptidase/D-esterase-like protein|nr:MAG: peptidase S58 family protein [Desulfobacteraceae bacterium]